MRNVDNWNSYLDLDGNILHGKLEYFLADGTNKIKIYDKDGTEIDNPQYTDIYGRTAKQVFIEDEDCLVNVWKYIGNGTMESDTEMDNWELLYTFTFKDGYSITIKGSLQAVGTVAELRELDIAGVTEVDGKKVILLLGYNEVGDKEHKLYIYDETSTLDDNGGNVIGSNGTGKWICANKCNAEDFGIFSLYPGDETDQTTAILNYIEYCNQKGYSPEFLATDDRWYYNIRNINVNSDMPIKVNEYTKFNCYGNNIWQSEIDGKEDELFVLDSDNTSLSITADVIYSGWCDDQRCTYNAGQEMIINSNISNSYTWTSQKIKIETDTSKQIFDNCNIEAYHIIASSDNIFNNMIVKEEWFTDDYDFDYLTGNNIRINLCDWEKSSNYIKAKNAISDYNYGNMYGRELTSSDILEGPFHISNFSGILNCNTSDKCYISDASFTLSPENIVDVDIMNSNVTVDDTLFIPTLAACSSYFNSLKCGKAKITNSEIASNAEIDNGYLNNVIIDGNITSGTSIEAYNITATDISAKALTIYDSNVNDITAETIKMMGCSSGNVNVTLACNIQNSIDGTVTVNNTAFTNEFRFIGNTCTELKIVRDEDLNVVVADAIIANNNHTNARLVNFVLTVDNENLFNIDDTKHNYSYYNNHEPLTVTETLTVEKVNYQDAPSGDYDMYYQYYPDPENNGTTITYYYCSSLYFQNYTVTIPYFAFGKMMVKADVEIERILNDYSYKAPDRWIADVPSSSTAAQRLYGTESGIQLAKRHIRGGALTYDTVTGGNSYLQFNAVGNIPGTNYRSSEELPETMTAEIRFTIE